MARYKRYFPVNQEINSDPEFILLQDKHGLKGILVWLEVMSLIDKHENFVKIPDGDLSIIMKQISGKVRTKIKQCSNIVETLFGLSWISTATTSEGFMYIFAPKYSEYHRTRKLKVDKLVNNSSQIGVPPSLPFPSPSLETKEVKIDSKKNLSQNVTSNDSGQRKTNQTSSQPKKQKKMLRTEAFDPDAFILSLEGSPGYEGIDLRRESGKMDVWLLAHHPRRKTKAFILNWLNRIDVGAKVVSIEPEHRGMNGRILDPRNKTDRSLIAAQNVIRKLREQEGKHEPRIVNSIALEAGHHSG